jgi:hypothetical protein
MRSGLRPLAAKGETQLLLYCQHAMTADRNVKMWNFARAARHQSAAL